VSYADSSAELTRSLARVLLTPPPEAPSGVELALLAAYRDDVLYALTALHRSLLRPAADEDSPGRRPAVADLEAQPVATLGVLLRWHPRGPASEFAPTDRAERAPDSPLGREWQQAARHALLAETAAAALSPGWNAPAEVAWGAVAEHAAAVEAFAVADTDLHRLAAAHPGSVLPTGAPPGLRTAAAEVQRVAHGGALLLVPDPEPPAGPVPRRGAVRAVAAAEHLPDAQLRVAALLAAPPALLMLTSTAVGQARAALLAAQLLRTAARSAPPEPADALRRAAAVFTARAEDFSSIAAAAVTVRGLRGDAGRAAVTQTGEILRHLQALRDSWPRIPTATAATPALLAFGAAGEAVLLALDRTVRGALSAGTYLVANPHHGPAWIPSHRTPVPAPLLQATARAAGREPARRAAFAGDAPPLRPPRPPKADVLRALAARAPARPERPTSAMPAPPAPSPWWELCATLDPRLVHDAHWPVLAAALTRAEQAGIDVTTTTRAAVHDRPLPAEHPARSLHYRLIEVTDAALTPAPGAAPPAADRSPRPAPAAPAGPAHRPAVPR